MISRIAYCILCYVILNSIQYLTYGNQLEYASTLVSKINESSDFYFEDSLSKETYKKKIMELASTCWDLWLSELAYFFLQEQAYHFQLEWCAMALIITIQLLHFVSPALRKSNIYILFFSYILFFYVGLTNSLLLLAHIIQEFSIEPIDSEL
jgi:hypothetical protein